MMPLMTVSLALGKIILLPYAHKFLRKQSITTDSKAAMFLHALLTSVKPLIVLTIGCCFPSSLTPLIASLVSLQHVYLLHGIVGNPCVCVGKMYVLAILVLSVRQAGILSLFLFRLYIRDLMLSITSLNIGCNFADINVNLLAYADDLVLLAPSWRALQRLLKA